MLNPDMYWILLYLQDVKVVEDDIAAGSDAACGTMDIPHEISLSESSKKSFLKSKQFSTSCWYKLFVVMFRVVVMLLLLLVLVSKMNILLADKPTRNT